MPKERNITILLEDPRESQEPPDRILKQFLKSLDRLIHEVREIKPHPRIEGAKIVYIVPDNQAPQPFVLSVATATDARGNAVDVSTLKYVVTSSDDAIATVGSDPSTPNDDTHGVVTFVGPEGVVTVNVQVEDSAGDVIGSFAANFTVTAGPPTAISGGSISFPSLTEVPDTSTTPTATP